MVSSAGEDDSERERRAHSRHSEQDWIVEIASGINLVKGRVTDRSRGGLGVRSTRPLRVGHSVSILIQCTGGPETPSKRDKISLEGEVRWSQKQLEEEEYRSGIEVQLPAEWS